jgi:hypothetical protein
MKWLRSVLAIGAGVIGGYGLFSFSWALFIALQCWRDWYGGGLGECGDFWFPSFAHAAATAMAERLSGPPETWLVNAAFIGWLASIVLAGFMAARLAPCRPLAHAMAVGSVVVGGYSVAEGRVIVLGAVVYALAGALLAGLGGLPVWWVGRRRARPTPES